MWLQFCRHSRENELNSILFFHSSSRDWGCRGVLVPIQCSADIKYWFVKNQNASAATRVEICNIRICVCTYCTKVWPLYFFQIKNKIVLKTVLVSAPKLSYRISTSTECYPNFNNTQPLFSYRPMIDELTYIILKVLQEMELCQRHFGNVYHYHPFEARNVTTTFSLDFPSW